MAITTAVFYSIVTVVALGLVAGLCAQLAKLSYDALVQRDVPEVVRTSVFARSETVFQICWVFGGALGISLPLIPQLGFGLVAAVALRPADLDDHRLAAEPGRAPVTAPAPRHTRRLCECSARPSSPRAVSTARVGMPARVERRPRSATPRRRMTPALERS